MATTNLIPTINAAGRFEALAPFDAVVDSAKYYSVEGIDTITKLETLKENLYELMFKPVGLSEADYPAVLARARAAGAIVVTLMDRYGTLTYVFSTYFKSFPQIDGVSYERMCMVFDLGPCHPGLAEEVQQTLAHTQQYILNHLGIETTGRLGTIPTIGYVSKLQSEAYENARKAKITDTSNDISKLREKDEQILKLQQYVAKLEAQLPPPAPPVEPPVEPPVTPTP